MAITLLGSSSESTHWLNDVSERRTLQKIVHGSLAISELSPSKIMQSGRQLADGRFECQPIEVRNYTSAGYLFSPNYPDDHPNWADCIFVLKVLHIEAYFWIIINIVLS